MTPCTDSSWQSAWQTSAQQPARVTGGEWPRRDIADGDTCVLGARNGAMWSAGQPRTSPPPSFLLYRITSFPPWGVAAQSGRRVRRRDMTGRGEQAAGVVAAPSESTVLVAGLWMILCAGLQYSFATFSGDLRTALQLSQSELEVLALGKDIGAYVGFVQGAFHDAHGPRRTVAVGAVMNAVGFGGLYALVGAAGRPGATQAPLWQPFLCLLIASNGAGWLDMGVLMTLLHNAGAERALASGVSKSLLGLGAAVFSCVYVSFLKPNARSYLLLCALTPPCVVMLAAPFLMRLPRPDLHLARRSPARASRLWGLGCWVSVLCAYLLFANAATQGEPSHAVRVGTTLGLVVLLVLPPLGLTLANLRPAAPALAAEHAGDDAEQCEHAAAAAFPEATHAAAPAPPRLRGQRSSELTLAGCMRCTEFWLMFVALSAGGGCALALINNRAQITTALHSQQGAESFVALFSVCNAAGRLLQGSLADWALRQGATPPTFLVVALLILSATQLACVPCILDIRVACLAYSRYPFSFLQVGERHARAAACLRCCHGPLLWLFLVSCPRCGGRAFWGAPRRRHLRRHRHLARHRLLFAQHDARGLRVRPPHALQPAAAARRAALRCAALRGPPVLCAHLPGLLRGVYGGGAVCLRPLDPHQAHVQRKNGPCAINTCILAPELQALSTPALDRAAAKLRSIAAFKPASPSSLCDGVSRRLRRAWRRSIVTHVSAAGLQRNRRAAEQSQAPAPSCPHACHAPAR